MHIRVKVANWNHTVQEWLRKTIYVRSPFKNRGVSQLWVFLVSAVWHGFYAGYYFTFFLWFVQLYMQGEIFRYVKDDSSKLKKIYNSLGFFGHCLLTVILSIIFSHNAAFFAILDLNLSIKLL